MGAESMVRWVRRLTRRMGRHGDIWRARDHLEDTLQDLPGSRRLAYRDVLPALDSLLFTELPRLDTEAGFVRRYLHRVDSDSLPAKVRQLERSVYATTDRELRSVHERNVGLAKAQLERVQRLERAVQRYEAQVAGLGLAIEGVASQVAASSIDGVADPTPDIERLRHDIEALSTELAELGADL